MIKLSSLRILVVALVAGLWSCVTMKQYDQLYGELISIRTKLDEVSREADMALASATCSREVIELMQSVSKFCTDKCTVNKLDIAISKVANDAGFLNLMKTQFHVAFYWSNPWGNADHVERLQKIIRKRQLSRTKVLIVANTTPRKTRSDEAKDSSGSSGTLNAEQEAAMTRANEAVAKLKEESAKLAASESGVLPIRDEDVIVWLVPYLRSDESTRSLPPDSRPPFNFKTTVKGKTTVYNSKDQVIKQDLIYQSVWTYLINCWPRNPDCKAACEKISSCDMSPSAMSCETNCVNPDDECAMCINEMSCEEIKSGRCISSCPAEPLAK